MAEAMLLQVGDRTVRLSNPDKVYFPERGFTKRDMVDYYLAVGDGIVRALRHRPTTLERWPGGVFEGAKLATRQNNRGDAFYQKRVPKNAPDWVQTATIAFPSGRTAEEICPTELAVVAWCANLGTVTFHPWPVRDADVEAPDELRIDLDPQPGTDFRDAAVACTSTYGSVPSGVSCRYAAPRSPWAGSWSGAAPTPSPPGGGRRSGGYGCSSTTTRWPATVRSPAPTRYAPINGPPSPRR